MARAVAAAVLALAVCCLLVSPAPARRPADLPPRAGLPAVVVDREATAEPLRPKPAAGAADCGEAADEQGTVLAVPEEDPARGDEEPRQWPSLLCLVLRCGGEPAHAGGALVAQASSSDEPAAMDEVVRPAVPEKAEAEDDEDERPYETDSDSDWDSDSDDEDEGGFFGWLWSLADRF